MSLVSKTVRNRPCLLRIATGNSW